MERKYGKWPQRLVMSAALLAAGPALAQMSPVSQHREITAWGRVHSSVCGDDYSLTDSEQAPYPGAWDAQVGVAITMCGSLPVVEAGAMQSSSMTPSEIRLETGGWMNCHGDPQPGTSYGASYDSEFSFTFRLSRTTTYTWSGSMAWSPGQYGSSDYPNVYLIGPDGVIYGQIYSLRFSTSGELEPGLYTVSGDFWEEVQRDYVDWPPCPESLIEFVFSMTPPPCPCDWSGDEAVNTDDFFMFLDNFFAGEADFNFDGATNSQDFFDFLGCFFAPPGGCA
jgi:hypothetical protein